MPLSTGCTSWGSFSNNGMCLSGASTTAQGPGALVRGGELTFTPTAEAGVFDVYAQHPPYASLQVIGFRGALALSQSSCQRFEMEATVAGMVRHLVVVALLAFAAGTSSSSAQAPARRVNLTGTVIAVNQQSDSVTLIDLKTMEAYRHVPVVGGPHEAAVSPDGRSVVVTNYNKQGAGQQKTLSVLALPSGDTIKTIDLGEYRAPHDVRWVDPTRVVVTSEANQALLLVNVTSGAIERVFRTEAGVSHMLALSTDRTRLYCSNMRDGSVSAFDFKTGEKIKDVKTGKECEGVGVTPDGRWVWAGNRAEDTISIIDTQTLEVTKRISSPGFPYRVQFTPDGTLALVPDRKSVV